MARKIYIASDQLLVSHLQILLEKAGISAIAQQSVVDAPAADAVPLAWRSELWVLKDGDVARALRLLQEVVQRSEKDRSDDHIARVGRGRVVARTRSQLNVVALTPVVSSAASV